MDLSRFARGAATAERMRRLMELRGVTPNGHPLWTGWEVAQVVTMYPEYGSIFPLLAKRTKPASYKKAGRLGITKGKAPKWTDNEILRLRKVYPAGTKMEVEAAFPGRSYAAVAKAANSRSIFRSRLELRPTGNRLLHQILVQARKLRLSNVDLDSVAPTKGYFSRMRWRTKIDERLHCVVARRLGATLCADFSK